MKDRLDNFSFIRTSGFVMMVLTILSMCFGVINARQDKDAKFEEVLDTLPSTWIRQMAKVFTWSVCSLFIVWYLLYSVLFGLIMD